MTTDTQETLITAACALLALAAALICLELAKGGGLRIIFGGLVLVLVVYKTAAWLFGE